MPRAFLTLLAACALCAPAHAYPDDEAVEVAAPGPEDACRIARGLRDLYQRRTAAFSTIHTAKGRDSLFNFDWRREKETHHAEARRILARLEREHPGYANVLNWDLGPDAEEDFAALEAYVRANALELDAARFAGGDGAVVFGESHPIAAIKTWLTANLAAMRPARLALEMFQRRDQALLERVAGRDPGGREAMLEVLRERWRWAPEAYAALVDAAVEGSTRVLGIDSMTSTRREARARGEEQIQEGSAAAAGLHRGMSGAIGAEGGVVVLIGSLHAERALLPKTLKMPARSFAFVTMSRPWLRAIPEGLAGQELFIPTPAQSCPFDGLIYTPAIAAESRGFLDAMRR